MNTNRLANEKSPYLIQHKNNPVDWYPWGKEAFDLAKKQDKPVFISIGYSTCHWCHVMERESFEDEGIAKLLNENYISIKVDREERPDIDDIYMNYCQLQTGHGGWPLSVFVTPEKQPFFSGTYFPRDDRQGLTGFSTILKKLTELWASDKSKIMDTAVMTVELLKNQNNRSKKEQPLDDLEKKLFLQYQSVFDDQYGGFGKEPKFPSPTNLMFLTRYWVSNKDETAKQMVIKTLDCMANGGIFDHIGFGFCRYSTDRKWLAPHFEKMLYDNALLAMAYLEAYHAFKLKRFMTVAKRIFEYINRKMISPEGGFYSAEDADSEGKEGKFYLWSYEEVNTILKQDAKLYCDTFDITHKGNFEGENIPNLIDHDIQNDFDERLDKCRKTLFEYREKRVHPFLDDKILCNWNGLMIAAFAMGSRILNVSEYADIAKKAASFLVNEMVIDDRLYKRYRDGKVAIKAFADDYACLFWGLLELYLSTYEQEWIDYAKQLITQAEQLFWDKDNGGYYLYGKDSEQLITRPKPIYDGAIPSANAVFIYNMIRLAKITDDNRLIEMATLAIETFSSDIASHPMGYSMMATCKQLLDYANTIIVFACKTREKLFKSDIYLKYKSDFKPFDMVLIKEQKPYEMKDDDYQMIDEKTTMYVCNEMGCLPPVTE